MSSPRRHLDAYYTPEKATLALLQHLNFTLNQKYILECCNGAGDITNVLRRETDAIVRTNDIDPNLKADHHLNVIHASSWLLFPKGCNWVISNPPFNQASIIIPQAYAYANIGITMLLRGSYTEPTFDRQHWLKEHEDHLAHIIYLPRISFTGDGKTDNVSCNWYVWTKERVSGCKVYWVTKEKR